MEIIIIILVLAFLTIIAYLCYFIYNQQYVNFVTEHSISLKELREINGQYKFTPISSFDTEYTYDNRAYFDMISPKDYLTYQLVYNKNSVRAAIRDTAENKKLHQIYMDRVKQCTLYRFDADIELKNTEKLAKIEKQKFNAMILRPVTVFQINSTLYLTKINGERVTYKGEVFNAEQILDIIDKLSQKHGDFYLNDDVWQAICRVERGKVSNKMRFSILERDGRRCKKCGRATNDLEIDHIFPISKGGKSTYSNLQTLCHRCNSMKSNTVEHGAVNPKAVRQGVKEICSVCGAPMVKRPGKYGDFYGCSNYPKCNYTRQIMK